MLKITMCLIGILLLSVPSQAQIVVNPLPYNPSGQFAAGASSICAAPQYSFSGNTNYGLNLASGPVVQLCFAGAAYFQELNGAIGINSAALQMMNAGVTKFQIQAVGATDAQAVLTNGAGTAGVMFDVTTDSTLFVKSRANGNGNIQAFQYIVTNSIGANVTPSISSGFGTSPSVPSKNGTFAFTINVGTGGTATNGVIAFNLTAATGWAVHCDDVTTQNATAFVTKQIASSTTTATIANFTTAGAQGAWASADVLNCQAIAY